MKPAITRRVLLSLMIVGTLLAVAVGLWVHWPWLQAEHDRLEPAYGVLIWSGDAATLLWFVWFGIRYCLFQRSLPNAASGDVEYRYLLLSLLAALAIDVTITILTARNELAGPNHAVQVQGEIIDGRPTVNEDKAYVLCRFQSEDQAWHESHLQIGLAGQPAPIREAIRQGRFPIPVDLSYDRHWPPRCWLVGFDNEEGNRLHWMSAAFLLFQIISLPLAVQFAVWKTDAGIIPLYKLIPLWAELTPFFLAALAKFAVGEC